LIIQNDYDKILLKMKFFETLFLNLRKEIMRGFYNYEEIEN